MNEFNGYHPAVQMLYFTAAIVFSCIFMHPAALIISVFSSFSYVIIIKGIKKTAKTLLYIVPTFFIAAAVNPMFNHRGVTVIAYLPSGNPLTAESLYYGLAFASVTVSVILFFMCLNAVMTSDKITYLFGRTFPSLSLIFSMTMRFVPEFIKRFRLVSEGQSALGRASSSVKDRLKNAFRSVSVTVTWSIENSIDAADSMKARGFGVKKRTAFLLYRMTKRDIAALIYIAVLSSAVILGAAFGFMNFEYFPRIGAGENSPIRNAVFLLYAFLLMLPSVTELFGVIKWKLLKSKI